MPGTLNTRKRNSLERLGEMRILDACFVLFAFITPLDSILKIGGSSFSKYYAFFVMAVALACAMRVRRGSKLPFELSSLLALFLYMVVSLLWSRTPSYGFSIYILPIGLQLLLLLVLSQCNISKKTLDIALMAYLAGATILLALFFANQGAVGLTGSRQTLATDDVSLDANGLGLIFSLAITMLVCASPRKRIVNVFRIVLVTMFSAGLLLTASRGAMLALLAGLVVSLLFEQSKTKSRWRLVAIVLGVIAVTVGSYALDLNLSSGILSRIGENTGRDQIWPLAIEASMEAPILGNGVGSLLYIPLLDSYNGSFENNFITIFFMLGAPGVVVLLLVYMRMFFSKGNSGRIPVNALVMLVVSFVGGLSIFTMKSKLFWFPIMVAILYLCASRAEKGDLS